MWLVICEPEDCAAIWAAEGLRRRGLWPLEVLHGDRLVDGSRWQHHLATTEVTSHVTLADGRHISGSEVRGVLNRLLALPPQAVRRFTLTDQTYVQHELQAFLLSWLHAVSAPVLNRPTSFGLSGQLRHASEWIWLATQAGLPNLGWSQTSDDAPRQWSASERLIDPGIPVNSVIVVDGVVTGAPSPQWIQAGCCRLSELSNSAVLGIDFVITSEQTWLLAGVSTWPDLRIGGEPLLDALAAAFTNGAAGSS